MSLKDKITEVGTHLVTLDMGADATATLKVDVHEPERDDQMLPTQDGGGEQEENEGIYEDGTDSSNSIP